MAAAGRPGARGSMASARHPTLEGPLPPEARPASPGARAPVSPGQGERSPPARSGRSRREKASGLPPAVVTPKLPPVAELGPEALCQALAARPIFQECSIELIRDTLAKAERVELSEREAVELLDAGPLLIVERGAVAVSVGPGPAVVYGPGAVFNTVGMLRLCHEAEPFRPSLRSAPDDGSVTTCKGAYEAFSQGRPAPTVFSDRRRGGTGVAGAAAWEKGQPTAEDINCFYSLCPSAALRAPCQDRYDGWVPFSMVGAPAGEVPTFGSDRGPDAFPGGATLAAVYLDALEEIGTAVGALTKETESLRQSLYAFRRKRRKLADVWRTIMSRCTSVFPAVPPEVLWAITEVCERQVVEAGQVIVCEGEGGEAGEALLLIDEGDVVVEKWVALDGCDPKVCPIGRLGAGAVIGDLGLIGTGIARAATARARTPAEVLVLSSRAILGILRRFPGFLTATEHRLREIGTFIQNRLPLRVDTLMTMELFSRCEAPFCAEIAGNGDRHLYWAGQAVFDPTRTDTGTVYVLEHGLCVAESGPRGQFQEFAPGSCFGGRTLLGTSSAAGAYVRVVSPLAVVLVIRERWIREAFIRHYHGREGPFSKEEAIPLGRSRSRYLSHREVFSNSSPPLTEAIAKAAAQRSYMPGQTLTVAGGKDTRLVILTGGTAAAEIGRGMTSEASSVSAFGELAMLGAGHKHVETIRAQTFCFTLEVHRTTFLEILEKFPDQRAQFELFAVKAIQMGHKETGVARWPFLEGNAPPRLLYLLDLYAGRRTYFPGDLSLRTRSVQRSAILILQGTAAIMNKDNAELSILQAGECYNEQALLGIPYPDIEEYVVPRTYCDIQILTPETWKKVAVEFPKEQEAIKKSIMTCMAERSAKNLGLELYSKEVLRMSPLMKTVSLPFVEALCKHMDPEVMVPGQVIFAGGKYGDELVVLLSGLAYVQDNTGRRIEYAAGRALGEAMLLGITALHPHTIKAATLCTMQKLKKRVFMETLQDFEADKEQLAGVLREARSQNGQMLQQKLARCPAFASAAPEFLDAICEHAEDLWFPQGAEMIKCGEPCYYGKSPLFVLLAGRGTIQNAKGVTQNYLSPGDLFGEGGALGLRAQRDATVRTSGKGTVHVAMVVGPSLEAAFRRFPEEREPIEEVLDQRIEANKQFVAKREKWVKEDVYPAMGQCPLFEGLPEDLLLAVGALIFEAMYKAGELITTCGQPADSMLVLLDGTAEVEGSNGEKFGRLAPGASTGEVNTLGLFGTRLATWRAVTAARVLSIPQKALETAMDGFDGPNVQAVRTQFERLRASRAEQVARGMPLRVLPIGLPEDCVAVRAIALQAERFALEPGARMSPLADTHPCGSHFWILAKGKAVLEVDSSSLVTRPSTSQSTKGGAVAVMPLNAGSLLCEGLAEEYAASVRASTACEAYRVRQIDFETAVASVPAAQKWLPRFRMVEAESKKQLHARAEAARGIVDGLQPHPNDPEIHGWGRRKSTAIDRAHLKATWDYVPLEERLPGMTTMPASLVSSLLMSPSRSSTRSSFVDGRRVLSSPDLRRCQSSSRRLSENLSPQHDAFGGSLHRKASATLGRSKVELHGTTSVRLPRLCTPPGS